MGIPHYIMKALVVGKFISHAWYDLTETDEC